MYRQQVFIFTEKPKQRNLNTEVAPSFLSPNQIKALKRGEDITLSDGEVLLSEKMTHKPAPPRSYAYCSDTMYNEAVIPLIKGCNFSNLLYHEATFLDELADRAETTQHSTAKQAGQIALLAKVEKLIIGHFSARYPDLSPLLTEAKTIFKNTELAEEGLDFTVGGEFCS